MPLLLLIAAIVAAAPPGPSSELTNERARQILPRADLSTLTDAQRAAFLEVAGDTFDYAGCSDTLARCLQANVTDTHALRMTELVKALLLHGATSSSIIDTVERYYASFAANKRAKLDPDDCGTLGDDKAKVVVVEFSDYQCPHCAHAVKPLHDMVSDMQGKVRLCSKYFPLTQVHPRAMISAEVAEYAKTQKKYWEMSQLLFTHQEELDDASLKRFAKQLGLDGDKMLRDAYAGRFDAVVNRQMKEGEAAGVQGTPALYFNGRPYLEALPIATEFLVFSAQDEEEWQSNHGAWAKR
ncbi:MAG TPA: thioredoxin domain-containing protein [Myxococcales bacterium]|jgi:protein-disulfide isomerase